MHIYTTHSYKHTNSNPWTQKSVIVLSSHFWAPESAVDYSRSLRLFETIFRVSVWNKLFVNLIIQGRQKPKKSENSNLHGLEIHRPSSKGAKLLIQGWMVDT